jgi:acyl-coenzyme A thioesterase PaaI-like protein
MIGANRTNMLKDGPVADGTPPTLDAPDDPSGLFAKSPFARCLGIRIGEDGTLVMPFSPRIIGNPILPAIHGGITGAFLETTAVVGVTRELAVSALPKPIGLTINYLRLAARSTAMPAPRSSSRAGVSSPSRRRRGRMIRQNPLRLRSAISCCGGCREAMRNRSTSLRGAKRRPVNARRASYAG